MLLGRLAAAAACSGGRSNLLWGPAGLCSPLAAALGGAPGGSWAGVHQALHKALHITTTTTSSSSSSTPAGWPQQPHSAHLQLHHARSGLLQLQQGCLHHHQHHHHQQQQLPLHLQQLQQQRGMAQLRPHGEAPKPQRRFWRPDKGGRLNRMVLRIPPQVQVALQDDHLTLTGKAGSTSLRLSLLDPTGLVAWQCHAQSAAAAAAGPGTGSLLLLASPSTRYWRSIQTQVDNAVHGVMQGYLVGLTVQGVGYRLEPVADDVITAALAAKRGGGDAAAGAADGGSSGSDAESRPRLLWEQEAEKSNIAYPHKQPARAVRLKVGYTKAAIMPLPSGVSAFFVKPTLMYLYGVDKQAVTNTAAALRAVRKPNAYTGNGVQLVGEVVRLKQRAGSK